MKQNRRYAVTGGIGSGKSTVMQILREMSYPVLSCDEISARLWLEEDYLTGLAKLFPDCVEGGTLQKKLVAESVFSDVEKLEKLNGYAHPRIMERLIAEMAQYPVAFAEVPLLFEGGYENFFDGVIAVRRKRGERLRAVMSRDGLGKESVLARMEHQFDEQKLEEKNCIIIENNGSLEDLKKSTKIALAKLNIIV